MVEFRKFTTKRKKDVVDVIIYIPGFRISGTIYLPLGGRLTDFLNTKGLGAEGEIFIPVTDASIYDAQKGGLLHYTPFLNVNKENILFVFPQDDAKNGKTQKKLDTNGKMP